MATTITVTVALQSAPVTYTFTTINPASLLLAPTNSPDATSFPIPLSTTVGSQIATATNAPLDPSPNLKAGSQTLTLVIIRSAITPIPASNALVAIANFSFNSTPVSALNNVQLRYDLASDTVRGTFTITIRCIHGSSLIEMRNGRKRIDQIETGDEVLSDGKYVKVKEVAHCWLTFQGVDHDVIIFEEGSLSEPGGENYPNKRLIIDPGHPMCTPKEYEEKGLDALRPAGTFLEERSTPLIYVKKWTDPIIQEDPSRRYDLILEESYSTYTANGIVVQTYGYKDHRYKDFV